MYSDNEAVELGCGCISLVLLHAFSIGWAILWWNIGMLATDGMGTAGLLCLYPVLVVWCAGPFLSITGALLK